MCIYFFFNLETWGINISFNSEMQNPNLALIFSLLFFLLFQTGWLPWLSWNLLCRLGGLKITVIHLPLPPAGMKGTCHHCLGHTSILSSILYCWDFYCWVCIYFNNICKYNKNHLHIKCKYFILKTTEHMMLTFDPGLLFNKVKLDSRLCDLIF